MRPRFWTTACVLAALVAGFLPAAETPPFGPPAPAPSVTRDGPAFPPAASPAKAPAPPAADAPVVIRRGQFYVVKSPVELVWDTAGSGKVGVVRKRGKPTPVSLPAESVIGWTADAGDDDLGLKTVTFSDDYLYFVRGEKSGPVQAEFVRAVNPVDKDGRQVPLTRADLTRKSFLVDLGDKAPAVTPKVDPAPAPQPGDDTPALFPPGGFRLLVLYEAGDLSKYQPGQLDAMYSGDVRDWLNSNCAKGQDGKSPEWRMWDQDVNAAAAGKVWADAAARAKEKAAAWKPAADGTGPRTAYPWAAYSNGKPGSANNYEGPVQAAPEAFLSALKRVRG